MDFLRKSFINIIGFSLRIFGGVIIGIGLIIGFGSAIWGIYICFAIIASDFGFIWFMIGIFVFPLTMALIPWYFVFYYSELFPLFLIYGGGTIGTVLISIGGLIIGIGVAFYQSTHDKTY